MLRISALLAGVFFALICSSANQIEDENASAPASKPTQPSTDLAEEIRAMDTKLFDAVFKNCDADVLQDLLSGDFEMYHDRGGLIATNRGQFVAIIRQNCERQRSGKESRSRRELVNGSLQIYPLNNYGAIQMGVHQFFTLRDGEPEKAGDIAKFIHVWKKETVGWRLARVLSYDHKPQ